MTKKQRTISRWVAPVLIFFLLLIGSWFLAGQRAVARYNKIINNPEFMAAFTEGDIPAMNLFADSHHMYYQKVENLTVTSAYGEGLPTPNFVGITHQPVVGVLAESPVQSLAHLRPYRIFLHGRFYTMFPFFPTGDDGYLIYVRVIQL